MSMCSLILCCWKSVFAMTSVFSWQNSISLCPASLYSKAKFACYSRYFLTSYFCIANAAKSLQSCPTLCNPFRQQLTRLLCPWDSPGKNTGVGCHFLLQCIKGKSESEVAQLCRTFSDPMDCSLPGSSVCRIFQARVLEWGAIAFSVLHCSPL